MNVRLSSIAFAVSGLVLLSQTALAQTSGRLVASAPVRDQSGALVGSVTFVQQDGGVQVRAEAWSMSPGFHGFHIHAIGNCTGDFTSAGGHFNRAGVTHAHHDGDMPSLYIQADGSGSLRFETDRFNVDDLFDEDGSSVMVHALPDNFAHIPTRYAPAPDETTLNTGDAGPRAACGVVE